MGATLKATPAGLRVRRPQEARSPNRTPKASLGVAPVRKVGCRRAGDLAAVVPPAGAQAGKVGRL